MRSSISRVARTAGWGFLTVAILLAGADSLHAQRIAPPREILPIVYQPLGRTSATMSSWHRESEQRQWGDSGQPRTYRTEGAIIGGAVLGLSMFLIFQDANNSDAGGSVSVPLVTIGGVAIGALIGAFIGGAIEKGSAESGNEVPTSAAP